MSVNEPLKKKRGMTPGTRKVTTEDEAVARRLVRIRTAAGLSQSALAAKVGVTFQQIQKYESGANRISAGHLVRLGRAMGVSPAAFFAESDLSAQADIKIDPQARKLITEFTGLPASKRQMVVALTKSLAREGQGDEA